MVPRAGNPMAWDRYAYVLNNPLRFIDPSGHFCVEVGSNVICSEDDDSDGWWLPPDDVPYDDTLGGNTPNNDEQDGNKNNVGEGNQLTTVQAAGKAVTFALVTGTVIKLETEGSFPRWHPDGKKIVYIKRGINQIAGDLFIIDLETMQSEQIEADGLSVVTAIWSPDGSKLLFSAYDPYPSDKGRYGIFQWEPETRSISFIDDGGDLLSWRSMDKGVIFRSKSDYLTYYNMKDGSRAIIPGLPQAQFISWLEEQPQIKSP